MDLKRFVKEFRSHPEEAGFVLDFDGTLSAVVDEPAAVAPVAGSVETLELLAERYALVAILSGRRAENVYEIVGARGVKYLGIYGAEELSEGALDQGLLADAWRGMASRLARDAEALIATEGLSGCEVEYKDLAVSVHYRRARDPERAAGLVASWAESAAPRRGFESNVGRMVVEIRPAGISKASALARMLERERLGWMVAAGDDYADVEALARAKELLSDRVLTAGMASREQPPGIEEVSDIMLPSPEAAVEFLRRFC